MKTDKGMKFNKSNTKMYLSLKNMIRLVAIKVIPETANTMDDK